VKSRRHFKLGFDGVLYFALAAVVLVLGTVDSLDTYWLKHRGEVVTATVLEEHHGRKFAYWWVSYGSP
jgi:hypothetical protein